MSTLREIAAVAAMEGILASDRDEAQSPRLAVEIAVECADLLVAELAKTAPADPELRCTKAERALIEAAVTDWKIDNEETLDAVWAAEEAVTAEREAAKKAKEAGDGC